MAIRHRVGAWQRRFGWWFDSCLALVALNVLHRFGLAAEGTIWLLSVVLVLSGISQNPAVARWLLGSDPPTRGGLWRYSTVGVVLTALACYLTGWGPLLGISFVVLASATLRVVGSRCWRPVLLLSLVAIACGQAGIALGWVHTYVPHSSAQAMGALGTVAVGLVIRILGLTTAERERDAAQRSRAERALRESEEATRRSEDRFRALIQDSCDVVAVTDASGRVSYVSSAVEHVMGYLPEEYLKIAGVDLVHPDDLAASRAMAGALLGGAREYRAEIRIRHADGTWHWHEVLARNLMDHPAVAGMVYNHRDITERKDYQERLAYDAAHDPLTGLANRATFLAALTVMCSGDRRGPGAVLFIDLDGFKRINDRSPRHRHGGAAGR
jgi:PAS domain S-box-containing protein